MKSNSFIHHSALFLYAILCCGNNNNIFLKRSASQYLATSTYFIEMSADVKCKIKTRKHTISVWAHHEYDIHNNNNNITV